MNKYMLAFLKGMLTVAVLLLLSTPLILMNVFQGDLSGPWIGFWGSFAGGILGTAGVIYVAHLQNIEQRRMNAIENKEQIKRMETVEENERNRLKTSTLLSMLQDYREFIDKYNTHLDEIYNLLSIIYTKKRMLVKDNYLDKGHISYINSEIINAIDKVHTYNLNFKNPLNKILSSNNTFKNLGLPMNDNLPIDKNKLLTDLSKIIESLTVVANMEANYDLDIEYMSEHLGYILKAPRDNSKLHFKNDIYIQPYEILSKWLNEEITIIDSSMTKLLNKL